MENYRVNRNNIQYENEKSTTKSITLMMPGQSSGNHRGSLLKLTEFIPRAIRKRLHFDLTQRNDLTNEQKYWHQQIEEIRRSIALDNIERDISSGMSLCSNDLNMLNINDLNNIKCYGIKYFNDLFQHKGQERDRGRER